MVRRTLGVAGAVLLVLCSTAGAKTVAVKSHERWQTPRPTLEQLAYHYWGSGLEAVCPNGSLHFRRTMPAAEREAVGDDDAMGASFGDCHPWLRRAGRKWPEICATAIHETGHERGLPDSRNGDGGVMEQGRMIVESRGVIHHRHGRITRFVDWSGVPNVCQPGYRIR